MIQIKQKKKDKNTSKQIMVAEKKLQQKHKKIRKKLSASSKVFQKLFEIIKTIQNKPNQNNHFCGTKKLFVSKKLVSTEIKFSGFNVLRMGMKAVGKR